MELRILHTAKEMVAVERLQALVWRMADLEVTPAHLLVTFAHNGGLVAGAFSGDELIGCVFGFVGLDTSSDPPRLKHCSHQLGVHPACRSAGVGFALKRLQWEFVRGQGIERITWTYDPLLARNAQLNIARLGAVCNTYIRNLYGEMQDDLNADLPSDRFQVDLWVNAPRVCACMAGAAGPRLAVAGLLAAGARFVNPPGPVGDLLPPDRAWQPDADPETWLLEIPADFLALKAAEPARALAWRMGTRVAFETLFGAGYIASGFVYEPGAAPRAVYMVSK
jgi:predicted GNAT superfamily acetyltransferase